MAAMVMDSSSQLLKQTSGIKLEHNSCPSNGVDGGGGGGGGKGGGGGGGGAQNGCKKLVRALPKPLKAIEDIS